MGAIIFSSMATTAGALHNLLSHLAMHSDIWERLFEEQRVGLTAIYNLYNDNNLMTLNSKLKNVMTAMRETGREAIDEDGDVTYSKAALERMKYLDVSLHQPHQIQKNSLTHLRLCS